MTDPDTTAQALATLREWDNEPDLQRALDSIEARIAELKAERDKFYGMWQSARTLADFADARAEQAERERDEALRLRSGSEWGAMAARVTQLEAALRDLLDDFKWENIVLARRALSTEGEPAPSGIDIEKHVARTWREPAEDRCPNPACGSRVREDNLVGVHDTPDGNDVIQEFCEDPWHTTPKEDLARAEQAERERDAAIAALWVTPHVGGKPGQTHKSHPNPLSCHTCAFLAALSTEGEPARLTRLSVIDYGHTTTTRGLVFEKRGVEVETAIQDQGRTLKVFLTDSTEGEPADPTVSHTISGSFCDECGARLNDGPHADTCSAITEGEPAEPLVAENEPLDPSTRAMLRQVTSTPSEGVVVGEPAEDRCPTCRSSSVPEMIECRDSWHKEDR